MLNKGWLILGALAWLTACGGDRDQQRQEYVALGKADGQAPAVQLIYAESWNHQKYGMSDKQKRFFIRVQNLAYDKDVAVHYRTPSGQWKDLVAHYVRAADDNTEIWLAETRTDDFAGAFAIKYAAEGITYWDNNNWRDYQLGPADGPFLGTGINVRVNSAYFSSFSGGIKSFRGTIDVRNLAYDKKVVVHYSTDGWQSQKQAVARYLGSWRVYGYSGTPNPNSHGVEGWYFEKQEQADELSYYVTYEVDGLSYRDDNFGANYTLSSKSDRR